MTVKNNIAPVLVWYMLAAVMYYLLEMYACYDCSTKHLRYVCFLIGHVLLLSAAYKAYRNGSTILKILTLPLVFWTGMAVIATFMWSLAPFLRYQ